MPQSTQEELQVSLLIPTNDYATRFILKVILKYAGRDATEAYSEYHSPSVIRDELDNDAFQGVLDNSTVDEEWKRTSPSPPVKTSQVVLDDQRPPLNTIINSYDFEEVAAKTASKKTFAFYSTAATDCWTRDMNASMYRRIWFRPRVLRDVADVDTTTTILGIPVKFPLFICPTGLAKMIHPEAEKGLARAAESTGILEIVS